MGIDASTVGFCMIGIFVASRTNCCSASMCPVSYCCAAEVRRVAVRIRTVWSVLASSVMYHVCDMCPYIDFKLESWSLGQVLCGVASPGFGEGGEADRTSSENSDLDKYEG